MPSPPDWPEPFSKYPSEPIRQGSAFLGFQEGDVGHGLIGIDAANRPRRVHQVEDIAVPIQDKFGGLDDTAPIFSERAEHIGLFLRNAMRHRVGKVGGDFAGLFLIIDATRNDAHIKGLEFLKLLFEAG